jgi:hypothetical protein
MAAHQIVANFVSAEADFVSAEADFVSAEADFVSAEADFVSAEGLTGQEEVGYAASHAANAPLPLPFPSCRAHGC